MKRQDIEKLYLWFGYKKLSKLTNVSVYKLRKMLEPIRQKDMKKIRKHKIINEDLEPTHIFDCGNLSYKSLFDANKHGRTYGTRKKPYTIAILKNLKTFKLFYTIRREIENSNMLEELIIRAQKCGEQIECLKIDNQAYIEAPKRLGITIQKVPKSTAKPYNSEIEQEIGKLQKVLQRNYDKIKNFENKLELFMALAKATYDNNPNELLNLKTAKKEKKRKIEIKQAATIRKKKQQ